MAYLNDMRKNEAEKCEICGRNFEEANLTKCVKLVTFPERDGDCLILCSDCNYRMYQIELENKRRIVELIEKTEARIAETLQEFARERDDIVSDSILSVVGTHPVRRRPKLDLLYKNPHWEMESETPIKERLLQRQKYEDLIWKAKALGVWDGNRVNIITKQKLEKMKEGV